jgi:hypothetical protein
MKTLLISCVLVVTSCLTNGVSADATLPQEITKHLAPQGQIVQSRNQIGRPLKTISRRARSSLMVLSKYEPSRSA